MAFIDVPSEQSNLTKICVVALNNFGIVPGICLLFYGLIREPSRLQRLLASKPFDLFGKASYAFYLVHLGVLSQFLKGYVSNNVCIMFLLTNLVAIALYKWVEHPIYQLISVKNKNRSVIVSN